MTVTESRAEMTSGQVGPCRKQKERYQRKTRELLDLGHIKYLDFSDGFRMELIKIV